MKRVPGAQLGHNLFWNSHFDEITRCLRDLLPECMFDTAAWLLQTLRELLILMICEPELGRRAYTWSSSEGVSALGWSRRLLSWRSSRADPSPPRKAGAVQFALSASFDAAART